MMKNYLLPIQALPVPQTSEELYLDLLKRCLTRSLFAKPVVRHTINPRSLHLRMANKFIRAVLRPLNLELVHCRRSDTSDYIESTHEARTRHEDAETMVGLKQLDQMQAAITDVTKRNVPGDLLEAGVWRGGMTVFMRGVLKALNERRRKVWVVDSFEGLPEPQIDSFGWRKGDMGVSLDEVKENFDRYGLRDDQVVFVQGWFDQTLPVAGIEKLAVLRVDADLYESTQIVLNNCYPLLSVGGYAIFDDYLNLADCRRAIDEYRLEHGIRDPIIPIDKRAVYWIKSETLS
ncbi:MAG: TylF/MycF family methyltransferase [Nitrospira sp.]|nr:TylF/MycF family methyltransferase [Nitrospira sp.]